MKFIRPRILAAFKALAILLLPAAMIACSAEQPVIHLNQTTPQEGLLSYFQAVQTGDAATIRACMTVSAKHRRVADDYARINADLSYFATVWSQCFPAKEMPIDIRFATVGPEKKFQEQIQSATVQIKGDTAIVEQVIAPGWSSNSAGDIHMRRESSRWKLDLDSFGEEMLNAIDRDKPADHSGEEGAAYFFIMRKFAPELRKIAVQINAGKIDSDTAATETKAAVDQAFQEVMAQFHALSAK